MRRVRDGDERDSIYNNYFPRIDNLVNDKVKDFLVADILVDLGGGVDAFLPVRSKRASSG